MPPATEQCDQRRIDFLLSRLKDHTAEEIGIFCNSATDAERQVMEAASQSMGRIPRKTDNGLTWKPLLAPEMVKDAVDARAIATNPIAATKLAELEDIVGMNNTVKNHAAAEILAAEPGAAGRAQ